MTTIHQGYLIAYYVPIKFSRLPRKNMTKHFREALVTIELLRSSKIKAPPDHNSTIYAPYMTNVARVIDCKPLNGDTSPKCFYLQKAPELEYPFTVGNIIRFKYAKLVPDETNIKYYTTKQGALNTSTWVAPDYTGDRLIYYPSGKIRFKYYYIKGCKTHSFSYRDDAYNTLEWARTFYYDKLPQSEEQVMHVREYLYDTKEKPVAQFILVQDKIIKSEIYDKSRAYQPKYLDK